MLKTTWGEKTKEFVCRKMAEMSGERRVSDGDHQEKKAKVLQTSDEETIIGKDYDQRKGGRSRGRGRTTRQ